VQYVILIIRLIKNIEHIYFESKKSSSKERKQFKVFTYKDMTLSKKKISGAKKAMNLSDVDHPMMFGLEFHIFF
jgi:hypothetical protein